MGRTLRLRWGSRRRRKQLDGGRDTPRVFSPSYPSDWQGRPLPSNQNHLFCSERMRRRRRKVCRSTMSAASPISLLAGSTPPCGKPSGYPVTSVKDMTAYQRVLLKLGSTHPTSHIWQLPERFRCSGWPCPHGLIRHHWTRRCSEERKEIWTDLGGGEAEMWEQFSKAFAQQVFLVTKISISNPTDWEAF